jgi:hypothetical protein
LVRGWSAYFFLVLATMHTFVLPSCEETVSAELRVTCDDGSTFTINVRLFCARTAKASSNAPSMHMTNANPACGDTAPIRYENGDPIGQTGGTVLLHAGRRMVVHTQTPVNEVCFNGKRCAPAYVPEPKRKRKREPCSSSASLSRNKRQKCTTEVLGCTLTYLHQLMCMSKKTWKTETWRSAVDAQWKNFHDLMTEHLANQKEQEKQQ